jgi:hypothetical protein
MRFSGKIPSVLLDALRHHGEFEMKAAMAMTMTEAIAITQAGGTHQHWTYLSRRPC